MGAISDMLAVNGALTHLDVSHNRVNKEGCLKLAEGIRQNQQLMCLELGFNPLGLSAKPELDPQAGRSP